MDHHQWKLSATCPADWAAHLASCGGGFFHSPPGLGAGAPDGEPVFALLPEAGQVVGLAVGMRSRCRLSRRPRHVYWPTLPALALTSGQDAALIALVHACADLGAAEVVVDSFDACWQPDPGCDPSAGASRARLEYLVALDADPANLADRYESMHRRHLRRGEREGWVLRAVEGVEAQTTLETVQAAGARRAEGRGTARPAMVVARSARASAADLGAPWGACVFGAWCAGELLAAALVGWGNKRAFYVQGGSTVPGYQRSAAVWLHWRIMAALAEHGCAVYNLGGTAAGAEQSGHPEHGLYRFKAGFGARMASCRGARWVLGSAHLHAHRFARWVSARSLG